MLHYRQGAAHEMCSLSALGSWLCPPALLVLQSHLERHGHTMLPSGDNLPVIFVKLATKIGSAFMLLLSDQLA